MSFLKQDLFASEFQFNMGSYGYKRGTSFGLLLSIVSLVIVKYDISLKDSSIQSETLQDISQELIKNDIALPSFQTKNFGSCEINLLSNRQKNQQINQEMQQNNLLIELASNSAILAQKNQENENMKIGLQSPKKSQFQISQTLRNKKSKRLDKQKSSPQSEKENYKINIKIDNHEIQSQKSQILDEAISQKLKSLQSVPIKQKIQSVIFKCKESSNASESIQDISQELIKNDIVIPIFQTQKFGSCETNLPQIIQKKEFSNLEKQQNTFQNDFESINSFLAQKNQENENSQMYLQNLKKSQFQFSQSLRNKKQQKIDIEKSPSRKKENYKINVKVDNNEIQSQRSEVLSQAQFQDLNSLCFHFHKNPKPGSAILSFFLIKTSPQYIDTSIQ
ncbi:hypothetical protein ABPG73_022887 [Tetrahymena malaccensis]